MRTSDDEHWFARCGRSAQDWLLRNPGSVLPQVALDAVIGAGGVPVRAVGGDDRSKAYYLAPSDSAYLAELRAAGYTPGGR